MDGERNGSRVNSDCQEIAISGHEALGDLSNNSRSKFLEGILWNVNF